jgi:carbon starvation protein
MLAALCVVAIGYRYYSAFIAAKALCLDDSRPTPAHTLTDGQNYRPTNRWVLFGHHFAAITGAGPLIGPVLAAQFGFLPGFLWILIGVVLGGAVHDFVILAASTRRGGRSLPAIARAEISPLAGLMAAIAVLFIVIISLAGLALAVVNALSESSWGTFTIGATIPIALFMGLYMVKLRPGHIVEATVLGVAALVAAVVLGRFIPHSAAAPWFTFSKPQLVWLIAIYGFFAAVLPVWLLLLPRDYLSAFMKLGTIAALILGLIVVNPELKLTMVSRFAGGGGPIISGALYPFVFITIACGAISGFHALVGSGTTPKLIDRESDTRVIGYGAMLCEGLVGIVALLATAAMPEWMYFAINVDDVRKLAALGVSPAHLEELRRLAQSLGETTLQGKTAGSVSLAVGMAQIFSALPGMKHLMAYWYHFAIMFEALFILTTIDAGTRIARFVVQELAGRLHAPLARPDWLPGNIAATLLVVVAWGAILMTGSIGTIWPMFGIANQLLASAALCVGTTVMINAGRARYAFVTLLPLAWVGSTTLVAGWKSITGNFLPLALDPASGKQVQGWVDAGLTTLLMVCLLLILAESVRRWVGVLRRKGSGQVAIAA